MTGLIFEEVGGIRIRITRRADLAVGRIGRANTTVVAVIETSSSDLSQKLRRVLEQVFVPPGSAGLMTAEQVDDAVTRCRRLGFVVHTPELLKRRKVLAPTVLKPIVETRRVPDPMMTRATLLDQLERYPDAKWIGYVRADVSMAELIGGMSRIRNRTEAQTKAAAEFRNTAERAQLGGAKAIDYGAVRVDTSGISADVVANTGAEARAKYQDAIDQLDKVAPGRGALAERVIIHGLNMSELAPQLGFGKGARGRDRLTRMVLQIADELAIIFGMTGERKSSARIEGWGDGSRAKIVRDEPT